MISWVAMDRMVERHMATDPEFRANIAGRPLRSSAKYMSDRELLARLRDFGVELDRLSLEGLCKESLSAEEVALPLIKKCVFKSREEEVNGDWIWVCVDALWQRWFPNIPSFEMLDDKMQAGYELMESRQVTAACRIWLEAWDDVMYFFDREGFETISEFDDRFLGSQSLFNWIQQLEMELWNAGLRDRRFLVHRIALCEKALEIHDEGETLLAENSRRALAESCFELGEPDKADRLYREWLNADPQWGSGWMGWSDCYRFTRTALQDAQRAEAILREGMAIEEVRNFEYMAERLINLYEEQGRTEEAGEVRREAELRKPASRQAIEIPAGVRGVSVSRTIDFGEEGLPLSELPQLAGLFRSTPVDVTGSSQKVGRNDSCPCGSGKKFKKCCGQSRQSDR